MRSVADDYAAAFKEVGETVLVRRYTGTNPRVALDVEVAARVKGFRPEQLVGGLAQGTVVVKLFHRDLVEKQFPLPMKDSDVIVVRDKELPIRKGGIDTNTGKCGTELIYVLVTATGFQ